MSLEQDVERGRQAQEVLGNAVYAESYTLIEQEIYKAWQNSREQADREQLHQLLRMLEKAKLVLESTMRSGKIAADQLLQKRNLAERTLARLRPS
ncbi:MAG: hypothetical protein M3R16_05050 [Pseudomonadota bacterium]|nr:hypothetical protein [Pseudomonadota bacterium]